MSGLRIAFIDSVATTSYSGNEELSGLLEIVRHLAGRLKAEGIETVIEDMGVFSDELKQALVGVVEKEVAGAPVIPEYLAAHLLAAEQRFLSRSDNARQYMSIAEKVVKDHNTLTIALSISNADGICFRPGN